MQQIQANDPQNIGLSVDTSLRDNPNVNVEELTPLAVRLEKTRPHLLANLDRLKEMMGEETYMRLINPMNNVTKSGPMLLMVAGDLVQRSLLERDYIPQIKEAFEVQMVRIVV